MPPAGIRRIAGQKSHKVTPILYLYRIYIVWGNNLYIRYLVLHQRPDVVYVNSVADSVVYSIHLLISPTNSQINSEIPLNGGSSPVSRSKTEFVINGKIKSFPS